MRKFLCTAALVGLAACGASVPESGPDMGSGVGFGDYDEYQARREAQLAGNRLPAANAVSAESPGGGSESEQIAAQTRRALGRGDDDQVEERAANSGERVVQASPDNPPPAVVNAVGISNENDFGAVGEQRTIEDDAERIAANRQQYEVASVRALPPRSGGQGPNIVAYALATKHQVGTQVYRRIGINKEAKFARNCAKYPSPDMAQIDFLDKGGPERDKLGLDPDGDGFACGWDPRPFRKASRG
ncbi:hypothetical protein D6850_04810 [Roseovarius spongiae]|uniref:Excalibur calcium-binding domain-containing protein n=1 Tax=Roseovarius spongiae TaxID=2320272 RepID=A0A3A8B0A3_9RHOB|nr:hypothetical protein [Roseovarius spongiae]RKF16860.1 hypothetical protein D6850_04810 [Roseovarius spongiae]